MRFQTRPFTVEIKSKKRTPMPTSLRHDEWLDVMAPGNLLEADVHEDLALATSHAETLLEAAKVFDSVGGGAQVKGEASPLLFGTEAPAASPRVLPDLVAAAREQERIEILTRPPPRQRRVRKASTPKAPSMRPEDQELRVGVDQPAPSTQQISSSSPAIPRRAELAVRLNRSDDTNGLRLPRGERWKERRLPRICWDRGRR